MALESYELHLGDCLELMRGMADSSVDAVVTDPPFFRVKKDAWDRQWNSDAEYLSFIGELCAHWQRILKPNGSLYVFASPQMSARVECKVREFFNVINHIVWAKEAGWHKSACKEGLRGYFPATERIIFAEQFGADNAARGEKGYGAACDELRGFVFEPLRAYLERERKRAGMTRDECNAACGVRSVAGGHYFSRSQWILPTQAHYEALYRAFNDKNTPPRFLLRSYEELRSQYEELRRPFQVTPDVAYTDVWNFATVKPRAGKHPCEKPVDLLRHIVESSTRPGALVLDPFVGSGSTGVACLQTGRRFLGIDRDQSYLAMARARLEATTAPQLNLFL